MIYAGYVKFAPGKPQTCRRGVKYPLGLLQRGIIYKTEHFGKPTKQTAAMCMSSTNGFIPSIANQSRRSSTNQQGWEQTQARWTWTSQKLRRLLHYWGSTPKISSPYNFGWFHNGMIFPTLCCTALSHLCTPKEKFLLVLKGRAIRKTKRSRRKSHEKHAKEKRKRGLGRPTKRLKYC